MGRLQSKGPVVVRQTAQEQVLQTPKMSEVANFVMSMSAFGFPTPKNEKDSID
jgi:hypothetical protein